MVATLRYQVKWPKLDQAHRLVFGRVELQHLLQWKLSTDVAVHDNKGIWTPSSDLVTEVVEASSCAKRSVFLQISHRHLVARWHIKPKPSANAFATHLSLSLFEIWKGTS